MTKRSYSRRVSTGFQGWRWNTICVNTIINESFQPLTTFIIPSFSTFSHILLFSSLISKLPWSPYIFRIFSFQQSTTCMKIHLIFFFDLAKFFVLGYRTKNRLGKLHQYFNSIHSPAKKWMLKTLQLCALLCFFLEKPRACCMKKKLLLKGGLILE